MDWGNRLYLTMMDCTVRAKMSLPPPAPAATTNSTGRLGCQSAADATRGRSDVAKTRAATIFLMRLLLRVSYRLRPQHARILCHLFRAASNRAGVGCWLGRAPRRP